MVIVGNASTLIQADPLWFAMLGFCQRHGLLDSEREQSLQWPEVQCASECASDVTVDDYSDKKVVSHVVSRLERGVLMQSAALLAASGDDLTGVVHDVDEKDAAALFFA